MIWLVSGSLAMGVGIWSMHFVGMLALNLPIAVQYDVTATALSMVWAVVASGMALYAMSREVMRWSLLVGGACISLAIVAMHYTGMAAMRIPGEVHYSSIGVAGSIMIALVTSYGAVWLSFRLARRSIAQSPMMDLSWESLSSATIMELGIGGMHYMAMAATRFQARCLPTVSQPVGRESPLQDMWSLQLGSE
jgi:NO-binding membrane sensor protein with MHYT domain